MFPFTRKLSDDDYATIRLLRRRVSQADLARRFGVSKMTITNVQAGRQSTATRSPSLNVRRAHPSWDRSLDENAVETALCPKCLALGHRIPLNFPTDLIIGYTLEECPRCRERAPLGGLGLTNVAERRESAVS